MLAIPYVEGAIGEFVDGGSVLMVDWRVHWSGEGWSEF